MKTANLLFYYFTHYSSVCYTTAMMLRGEQYYPRDPGANHARTGQIYQDGSGHRVVHLEPDHVTKWKEEQALEKAKELLEECDSMIRRWRAEGASSLETEYIGSGLKDRVLDFDRRMKLGAEWVAEALRSEANSEESSDIEELSSSKTLQSVIVEKMNRAIRRKNRRNQRNLLKAKQDRTEKWAEQARMQAEEDGRKLDNCIAKFESNWKLMDCGKTVACADAESFFDDLRMGEWFGEEDEPLEKEFRREALAFIGRKKAEAISKQAAKGGWADSDSD